MKMSFEKIAQAFRNHYLRWILVSTLFSIIFAFCFLMPPVWKLRDGPIVIHRWLRSGPQDILLGPKEPNWVALSGVSHHVIHAIVVAEDARFFEHGGLDWREIRESIAFNVERKRYARGASTITQQVVKLSFLDSEKTILRKFREAIGAMLLEQIMDKDQILEWYINLAAFGDGIFGIKAAAQYFFQENPELLTIQDGALLAMVLPSPNRWTKALKQKELTGYGHRRYTLIIDEMFKLGFITRTLRDTAMATGNFGRPISGYSPIRDSDDELLMPYVELPGKEPSLSGHNSSPHIGPQSIRARKTK